MTFPPRPCTSICLPAARAISQDCVTLASCTSRKSSGFCSVILDTLLSPEATTRMSTPPNVSTAVATILSQLASDEGRSAITAALPPSASHSPATLRNSASLLAASTTLAPAPASTFAASAPNAPDAPVTIAVLPRMSNRVAGSFRKSSDMGKPHTRSPDGAKRNPGPVLHQSDSLSPHYASLHAGYKSVTSAPTSRPAWSRRHCRG